MNKRKNTSPNRAAGVIVDFDGRQGQPNRPDEPDLTLDPQHIGLGLQGEDDTGSQGDRSSTFDHPGDGGPG